MLNLTPLQLLITMTFTLFLTGLVTFLTGAIILIVRSNNKDIRAITSQTSNMVQKGIAEDISGLVGNASALLSAMNDLAKTQNGVGIILIIIGSIMMVLSSYLIWYITFRAE